MTAPASPTLTDARQAIAIMERMKETDAGDGLETSDHDTVIAALLLAAERAEGLARALEYALSEDSGFACPASTEERLRAALVAYWGRVEGNSKLAANFGSDKKETK